MFSNPIVLFRFHDNFDVCRQRLALLNELNPGVPIYAVYGGPPTSFATGRAAIQDLVADVCATANRDRDWHWLHVDLDVKHWYRTRGYAIDFDILFDYEWDIVAIDSLRSICPTIDQHTVALCSLTRLTRAVAAEWQWTARPEYRPAFERFRSYMYQTFGLEDLEYASHGPGAILPRTFLAEFASFEDNELVISELSYPAYACALGFGLVSNNFRSGGVTDVAEQSVFNSAGITIAYDDILAEAVRRDGHRAFHPVKYSLSARQLRELHDIAHERAKFARFRVTVRRFFPPRSYIYHCDPLASQSLTRLIRAYVWQGRKLLREKVWASHR